MRGWADLPESDDSHKYLKTQATLIHSSNKFVCFMAHLLMNTLKHAPPKDTHSSYTSLKYTFRWLILQSPSRCRLHNYIVSCNWSLSSNRGWLPTLHLSLFGILTSQNTNQEISLCGLGRKWKKLTNSKLFTEEWGFWFLQYGHSVGNGLHKGITYRRTSWIWSNGWIKCCC